MKKSLTCIAAAAGIAALGTGLIAWYDTHHFIVRHYTVTSPKIRRKTRIVFLADLHDQVFGRHNRSLLDAIEEQQPDLILCGGDLITAHHNATKQRGEEATALLMTLAGRYPLLAINGNHETKMDSWRDIRGYGAAYDDYESMVHAAGGIILRNEHVSFADRGIVVTGLELPLPYFRHFLRKPLPADMLTGMIGESREDAYQILLAHHPDYFPEYRAWGADLTLSGHIHGGIIRLPFLGGVISPTGWPFPKYDGGRFDEEGRSLILSRGLGTHTIPVRVNNPGELTVIDLEQGAD
ncbi:MAG: metallophosphoesterase [Lachnospiraceae bacterium]|nr:metallophosphoesterase [Lachnospiraceae bacterium]